MSASSSKKTWSRANERVCHLKDQLRGRSEANGGSCMRVADAFNPSNIYWASSMRWPVLDTQLQPEVRQKDLHSHKTWDPVGETGSKQEKKMSEGNKC